MHGAVSHSQTASGTATIPTAQPVQPASKTYAGLHAVRTAAHAKEAASISLLHSSQHLRHQHGIRDLTVAVNSDPHPAAITADALPPSPVRPGVSHSPARASDIMQQTLAAKMHTAVAAVQNPEPAEPKVFVPLEIAEPPQQASAVTLDTAQLSVGSQGIITTASAASDWGATGRTRAAFPVLPKASAALVVGGSAAVATSAAPCPPAASSTSSSPQPQAASYAAAPCSTESETSSASRPSQLVLSAGKQRSKLACCCLLSSC